MGPAPPSAALYPSWGARYAVGRPPPPQGGGGGRAGGPSPRKLGRARAVVDPHLVSSICTPALLPPPPPAARAGRCPPPPPKATWSSESQAEAQSQASTAGTSPIIRCESLVFVVVPRGCRRPPAVGSTVHPGARSDWASRVLLGGPEGLLVRHGRGVRGEVRRRSGG